MTIPRSVKHCIVHCGTNNLSTDSKFDIVKGLVEIVDSLLKKQFNLKIIIIGILPRENKFSSIRDKLLEINNSLCRTLKNRHNVQFIKPDSSWTLPNGELNPAFYSSVLASMVSGARSRIFAGFFWA